MDHNKCSVFISPIIPFLTEIFHCLLFISLFFYRPLQIHCQNGQGKFSSSLPSPPSAFTWAHQCLCLCMHDSWFTSWQPQGNRGRRQQNTSPLFSWTNSHSSIFLLQVPADQPKSPRLWLRIHLLREGGFELWSLTVEESRIFQHSEWWAREWAGTGKSWAVSKAKGIVSGREKSQGLKKKVLYNLNFQLQSFIPQPPN